MQTGCYGDGAFGHQHCRERLAEMLESTVDYCPDVVASLRSDMPDDAWDEYDALKLLNDAHPNYDTCWGFQDGDFGLWPIEEE